MHRWCLLNLTVPRFSLNLTVQGVSHKHCLLTFFIGTVNVLKFRTLKNNYFSAVRNFRNYVSEKVLVFVILECGL